MYPMGLFAISFQFAKSQTPSSSLAPGLIGDKIPPLLAQRLEKGKAVYEQFKKRPKLIVSGGQGSDELIAEAEAMARYFDGTWGARRRHSHRESLSYYFLKTLTFSKRILEEEVLGKRVLVVTNSFHALRAGVFMRRLKIPGRSIGSRTAFTISHPLGFEKPLAWFHFYWKWHVTFLAFLFLPWFFTQIMKLIEFFMQHLN